MQGYLVYKFIKVNVDNQTGYIVLIDAETAMNFTPSRVNQLVRLLNPIFGTPRAPSFWRRTRAVEDT